MSSTSPSNIREPGAVLEGIRTKAWDVAFLVFEASRAEEADFSHPYMQTDFTYLVPINSSIRQVADADQTGIRIAVPQGDGSDLRLDSHFLKRSELVRADRHAAALELVRSGSVHARAAPRPVLLAEAERWPGLRVLDEGIAPIFSMLRWCRRDKPTGSPTSINSSRKSKRQVW